MAPIGLIVTIVLKVMLRPDTETTLIVRNATGEYGFTAVQCTSSPIGLEGAIKMELIEPRSSATSAYNVHLKYQSVTGDILYLKVDNTTNSVFLDKERSALPPFKAELMPIRKGEEVFVFSATNADNLHIMKIKKTSSQMRNCSSQKEDTSRADAGRYIDSQELFMIPPNGGIVTHRHIVGHVLEC